MGLFDKLKQGLTRTAQQIADRFDDLVKGSDAPERRSAPSTRTRWRASRRCS
ncbi:MAG: hypothetical protein R2712_04105 [Vicinamibacterales bacterium]